MRHDQILLQVPPHKFTMFEAELTETEGQSLRGQCFQIYVGGLRSADILQGIGVLLERSVHY